MNTLYVWKCVQLPVAPQPLIWWIKSLHMGSLRELTSDFTWKYLKEKVQHSLKPVRFLEIYLMHFLALVPIVYLEKNVVLKFKMKQGETIQMAFLLDKKKKSFISNTYKNCQFSLFICCSTISLSSKLNQTIPHLYTGALEIKRGAGTIFIYQSEITSAFVLR